jgi:hypothetical protein
MQKYSPEWYESLDKESSTYKTYAKFNSIRQEVYDKQRANTRFLKNVKNELETLLETSDRLGRDEAYIINCIVEDIVIELRR